MPVLYTFRRCPYAMRARMALAYAGVQFEIREVVLRNKPQALLTASPKGTVPVMLLEPGVASTATDGSAAAASILEESLDIMHWALAQADPDGWLAFSESQVEAMRELVTYNDEVFKQHLDRYKYADRYPAQPASVYRAAGETHLQNLNTLLQAQPWLFGARCSFADIALLPFVRQFVNVDPGWFASAPYPELRGWLQRLLDSELFQSVMTKYAPWAPGAPAVVFPTLQFSA
ncbi:MAG: glutathione S-transferase [Pseudomonadota bacterium]